MSFEDLIFHDVIELVHPGRNVLAIHGLNATASLLIFPRLQVSLAEESDGVVLSDTTLVRARAWTDGERHPIRISRRLRLRA